MKVSELMKAKAHLNRDGFSGRASAGGGFASEEIRLIKSVACAHFVELKSLLNLSKFR
jgi:hypothetical protein